MAQGHELLLGVTKQARRASTGFPLATWGGVESPASPQQRGREPLSGTRHKPERLFALAEPQRWLSVREPPAERWGSRSAESAKAKPALAPSPRRAAAGLLIVDEPQVPTKIGEKYAGDIPRRALSR